MKGRYKISAMLVSFTALFSIIKLKRKLITQLKHLRDLYNYLETKYLWERILKTQIMENHDNWNIQNGFVD